MDSLLFDGSTFNINKLIIFEVQMFPLFSNVTLFSFFYSIYKTTIQNFHDQKDGKASI